MQVGAPQLTVNTLYVIENGRKERGTGRRRRHVTVDELLILAVALGVTPVDLLVPSATPDDEPFSVAPKVTTTAGTARKWITGGFLKPPESPAELAAAIRFMPKERAQAVSVEWFRRHGRDYVRAVNAAQAEERHDDWWPFGPPDSEGQDHDE